MADDDSQTVEGAPQAENTCAGCGLPAKMACPHCVKIKASEPQDFASEFMAWPTTAPRTASRSTGRRIRHNTSPGRLLLKLLHHYREATNGCHLASTITKAGPVL